jgi:uncharacterized repeat protein (TIGR03917 family)
MEHIKDEGPESHVRTALPAPLADVTTVRHGLLVEHELILSPGATAADIAAAMIRVPPTAGLVDVHGEVRVSMVFREVPREG